MKYVIVLVVGLVAGFFIARATATAPPLAPVCEACPVCASTAVSSGRADLPTSDVKDEATSAAQEANVPDTLVVQKGKNSTQYASVHFTADLINQMEAQMADLPKQATFIRDDQGWSVQKVAPGSLFAKAGFSKGDFITNMAVESFHGSGLRENSDADRVIRIIDQVSGM